MIFIPHSADNLFKRRGSASDQEMASIGMLLVLIQHIGKGLIELPLAKLRLTYFVFPTARSPNVVMESNWRSHDARSGNESV